MKTNTLMLLFGFTLFSLCSFCQLPQTFPHPENNPLWLQFNEFYNANRNSAIPYCLHDDTVINSEVFHKIYNFGWIDNDSVSFYFGAVREDAGKIYFVYKENENQSILFDFTANESDTIWTKSTFPTREGYIYVEFVVVESIDSMEINGNLHKVMNVTDGFHHDSWIEGIGNDGELFAPITMLTDDGFMDSYIKCFMRDGNTYYPDSTSTCFTFSGIAENTIKHNPFSVYPNPANSIVEIKSSSLYRIHQVNVINFCGSILKSFSVNEEPETQISLDGLQAGNYILEIETANHKRFYSKIVKN